jgi:hypothetical protein
MLCDATGQSWSCSAAMILAPSTTTRVSVRIAVPNIVFGPLNGADNALSTHCFYGVLIRLITAFRGERFGVTIESAVWSRSDLLRSMQAWSDPPTPIPPPRARIDTTQAAA